MPIERTVQETVKMQIMEISKFYLTYEMLKDIIKLDLALGGGLPVYENLQQGMSMLNILPIPTHPCAGSEQDSERGGENSGETKNTHTYNEAEKGSKNDQRKPVGTYDKLKKIVTMYTIFLLTLLGYQNQHYLGVWSVRRIMGYRENNTFPFTEYYYQEITWAIVIGGRHYFDQHLMSEDYKDRDISQVDFPLSHLDLTA